MIGNMKTHNEICKKYFYFILYTLLSHVFSYVSHLFYIVIFSIMLTCMNYHFSSKHAEFSRLSFIKMNLQNVTEKI